MRPIRSGGRRITTRASCRTAGGKLGRLSAEAVQAQYETAAKSVEAMGDEVRVRIAKLEAALAECDADMRLIAEGANAIREKGKLVSLQIEEAAIQCKDIRDICDTLKAKLGA
jgi:hypothetical protein